MILVFLALLLILKFNSPAVYTDYLIGLLLVLCAASAAFTVWVKSELHLFIQHPEGIPVCVIFYIKTAPESYLALIQ